VLDLPDQRRTSGAIGEQSSDSFRARRDSRGTAKLASARAPVGWRHREQRFAKPLLGMLALPLALVASASAEPLFRAPSLIFATGPNPTSVAIADLNGDGRPDLVVTNGGQYSVVRGHSVSVLFGNGDGTFGSRSDLDVGELPQSVVVADLNGDGRPDLAVGNAGPSP